MTDIFRPTLRNFFYKRWPLIFLYGKGCFAVLGVAYKIFNVGRLGFFVRAQPKLFFGRHRHVLIYSARKTLTHLGKKSLFSDTDWKKKTIADVVRER